MTDEPKKRRSFRIVESAFVMFEIISDLDYHQGLERWKMSRGTDIGIRSKLLDIDARFKEKLFVLKTDSIALAECLSLLNEKISTFMDELPALKESKQALAKQQPQACEIGADGMMFGADRQLDPDTKMVLRFLLSSDSRYVETFARVVRSVEPPKDDNSQFPYSVAVEFMGMKSEQKDVLIQHLFDRESETLRMRRLQLDAHDLAQQAD